MKPTVLRLAFAIAIVALVAVGAWTPALQTLVDEQIDAGLKRALLSFASARTLNAVISVVQGTEFSVQPLGVGVTLTLGQVLDPINDLVEQFASLMLMASVAFGVQKALLAIGGHAAVSAAVTGVALLWAGLHVRAQAPAWLARGLVVLMVIRFAIPVAAVGSDWVFRQFHAEDYRQAQRELDATGGQLGRHAPQPPKLQPGAAAPERGLVDRLKDRATEIATLPSIDLEAIRKSAEAIPERVLGLIVIFLLQTLIVPIALLWALYRVAIAATAASRGA